MNRVRALTVAPAAIILSAALAGGVAAAPRMVLFEEATNYG